MWKKSLVLLGIGALLMGMKRSIPAMPTSNVDDDKWIKPEQWLPLSAPLKSVPGQRASAIYMAVAEQFDVTRMLRYAAIDGKTWCNIYVWDVTTAMGCEIPHWFDPVSGARRPVAGGSEMSANMMINWLERGISGWRTCSSFEAAKARAAAGYPVVAAWRNPYGPGHVAMVLPDGMIAQAGAANFWRAPLASGFGNRPVSFFTHD